MWKIILGFVVVAGLAMVLLLNGGGDIDMTGEKHSVEPAAGDAKK